MTDLRTIDALIARARTRLRLQAALEVATLAGIPAVAGALVALWLWRMEVLTGAGALISMGALALGVAVAAFLATLRKLPTHVIARRIDRASGLSDRLGTAVDFQQRLRALAATEHPDTVQLMRHAIADGVAAVPRANLKLAAPFTRPEALVPLAAFAVVAALVCLLSFRPDRQPLGLMAVVDNTGQNNGNDPDDQNKGIDVDDLDYSKQFVEDMKDMAEQTGDKHLNEFAEKLADLLEKAERGELSKEEMMAKMEALEKQYMEGAEENVDEMMQELKDMASELAKSQETKGLADALKEGDMQKAGEELEKLAEKMEKGEIPPEQEKKLADALEKAAEKAEKKQQEKDKKEEKAADKEQKKKEDEIRKLKKKLDEQPQNEEAKRQLQKKERELEQLKRDREEKKEQAKKRSLDRLQRNMKQAASEMKKQNKQEAAKNMKDMADETRKIEDQVRKINNQKRVQSQLADLKEAIRRAKPKKGNGNQSGQSGRAQRIKDYQQRAGGQQGNAQAWRQGQNGKGGQQNGPQQPSNSWGTGEDPNLMGDPTQLNAKKKNEDLTGIHGQGVSRRETILTAAKKGFATRAYKKVYADYKKVVEEVIAAEKVPQGYKYYVKRYFQRIKPHSMD
jgi:hypothetical protein